MTSHNLLGYSTLMSDQYFHCMSLVLHVKQTLLSFTVILLNTQHDHDWVVSLSKCCFTHFKTKEAAAYKYIKLLLLCQNGALGNKF